MNNQQKTIAFWLGAVLGAVVIIFFLVSINQKINTATTANTVTFSGMGKVSIKPDIAIADFSIVTDAKTSKEAQDKNSAKSNAVTEFLKKQGVEERDIKTVNYNIYPQYYYPQYPVSQPDGREADTTPRITSYQVNQSYQVKIRNFDKASSIVDGLVGAGVNQVNNLSFQLEEPEKAKAEARAKAVADAKMKADELQDQIGVRIGKIVNFQENVAGYPGVYYDTVKAGGAGYGGGGPSLPTGENEVTVEVTLTYQIK